MAAIYQWFVGDEVVYTTTLYPIDVTDGLQLYAATNPYGNLSIFPVDYTTTDANISDVYLDVVLLSGDTGEDYTTTDSSIPNIYIDLLLQSGDTGEDYSTTDSSMIDIYIDELLVTCDTPDESLQLSCTVNAAGSSLTPVQAHDNAY